MDKTTFKYEVTLTLTRGEKRERYFLTPLSYNCARTNHQIPPNHRHHDTTSAASTHFKEKGVKLILNRMEGNLPPVSFMSALTEFELFFARKTGHRDFTGDKTRAEKRPSKVVVTERMPPRHDVDWRLLPDIRPAIEKGWENDENKEGYELLGPFRDRHGNHDNDSGDSGDRNGF
ncbi:hypothetical protein PG996_007523 [Apiospora saccharicola]|uniref:Uncharacterized protein n=1 Tax=Apiospora saccharicola TaxID=335842 RepID=A0ABR1VB40_9PEZI